MSEKKRILFLTANPTETAQLCLEREARDVGEELQRSQRREDFELKQQRAVRIRDLRRAMFDNKPQIVHFSGHGTQEGLVLEDDDGRLNVVATDALSGFFRLFANQVECVLLNACYSAVQAEAIGEHIKYVIGMRKEIGDEAAINFAVGFYQALGAGFSIEDAFESGKNNIQMQDIPEDLTPVLLIRKADKTAVRSSSPLAVSTDEPIAIFYSYSHRDKKLRDELDVHLSALRQRNIIKGWSDHEIKAGEEWGGEIDSHLNSAQIILLLVSQYFIASKYCYNIEMERAMERHEKGEARVIPIILRECDWHDLPFAKLQALPVYAEPITSWRNRNEAFYNVASGIKAVVEKIRNE